MQLLLLLPISQLEQKEKEIFYPPGYTLRIIWFYQLS